MDERRRDQREKRLRKEVERERKENPKITEQFRDLKRQLADVSYEQWDGIPEIGDYTVKKQKRFESFVPGSDALLAKAVAQGQVAAREVRIALYLCDYLRTGALRDALADSAAARSRGVSGLETPAGPGVNQDLTSIGAGKKTMLALNLDKMGDDGGSRAQRTGARDVLAVRAQQEAIALLLRPRSGGQDDDRPAGLHDCDGGHSAGERGHPGHQARPAALQVRHLQQPEEPGRMGRRCGERRFQFILL